MGQVAAPSMRRLLIANRGEIAGRIARSARRMGLTTIAVYSEVDAGALHVAAADMAVPIGPADPAQSYLNIDAILTAANATHADAVHPGYGFLAENADFAEACIAAGLTFVGPPPEAIRAMGRKDDAKALMAKAGLPVVPGYDGADQSEAALVKAAKRIGFPVLIKAVAGGGGKGMRRVERPQHFAEALAGARREAKAAFGDDRMLLEAYLPRARHIEMQVFADRHGRAVHLFERDCSLQRRHQKVIEEAPAPGMTAELRRTLGDWAMQAVRALPYEGAGTVEFIADVSDGLRADRIYFMEMNTRLQVEHPVTELITGLDLVAWQLRIAAGKPLPRAQEDIKLSGHAIEARLYAEDPARNFVPSPGTLHHLNFPDTDDWLRIDTGVRPGDRVSRFYDPMIAKLITYGPDRTVAINRLRTALERTEIAGIAHNGGYLVRVLTQEEFAAGDVHTHLLADNADALSSPNKETQEAGPALAATAAAIVARDEWRPQGAAKSPWDVADGWRITGRGTIHVTLTDRTHTRHTASVSLDDTDATVTIDGPAMAFMVRRDRDATVRLQTKEGRQAAVAHHHHHFDVMLGGDTFRFDMVDPLEAAEAGDAGSDTLSAPLPGRIAAVLCKTGDAVTAGQPLVILEAMKMEHRLVAPAAGIVADLAVAPGDQVEDGRLLLRLQTPDNPGN